MEKLIGFSVVLLLVILCSCDAYIPRVIRGRPSRGLFGSPVKHHKSERPQHYPGELWYNQTLDHFNDADMRRWNQRYFINTDFYKTGGPLFVQIGGEQEVNPSELKHGAWIEYAQKYNASCVLLEHRFYGMSHPTSDMSTENLRFLSSEQALADLAAFIKDQKVKLMNPKVIIFGGSYAGSLSAWFRLKYPCLADGAVASSAPLLAVVNFKEFMHVVGEGLLTFDSAGSCNQAISAAVSQMKTDLTSREGRMKIKRQFQLCDDIEPDNKKDMANLFFILAYTFAHVVQYNHDRQGRRSSDIDSVCGIMTDSRIGDVVQRYADIFLGREPTKCKDFKYYKHIAIFRDTSWNSSTGTMPIGRQWAYQACTEFAFCFSSDDENQPFGHDFPIDFWTTQCADIFGPQFNLTEIQAAVNRTNENYGGLDIKVTKIVFPNGSIDPWHPLGVLKDLGPDAKAIFINGTSHCADMHPSSWTDPPQLTQARTEISESIGRWLKS